MFEEELVVELRGDHEYLYRGSKFREDQADINWYCRDNTVESYDYK